MRSLVTGASGFIGGHLTRALIANGSEVRVLVRPTSKTHNLHDIPVDFCVGELSDPASLHRAVTNVDCVFHCAAVVWDWGDPAVFRAANVDGTELLLKAAMDANVGKFVHVSSTEIYGHPDFPATEDAPYRYRGWQYCDTKIEAEKLAWRYYHRGLPLTVVRPATVYGPRSSTIVELVKLLQDGQMWLVAGGRKNAGLVYVENLCDLLSLCGEPEAGLGRAYNVTDGLDITWAQWINGFAQMMGKGTVRRSLPRNLAYAVGWALERWGRTRKQASRPWVTRMTVEFTGTDQGFPNDRAQRELGWRPRVGYSLGMNRVRAWLDDKGYLQENNVASAA
jgi:nucleoside-diphosphate-sugar epimerase